MKYRPYRYRRSFRWKKWLIFAAVLYVTAAWLISPRAVQLAETEIRRASLVAIHNATKAVVLQFGIPYGEIGTKEDGTVAYLQTNTSALTKIQTELCSAITNELSSMRRLSVSSGSLTSIAVFSGKGPKLHLWLEPDSVAEVFVKNEFVSVGVNQTLHRVRVDVTVQITVRALWYTKPQTVQASFVLGETVIVGDVPGGLYAARAPE